MHQRRSLPVDGCWGLSRAYDPFCAADMADFVAAALGESAAVRGDPAELAPDLSKAALTFMFDRRLPGPIPAGEIASRMKAIAETAASMLELMGDDLLDVVDPDIGHTEPVRRAMGIPVGTNSEDWPRQKDAARGLETALTVDLPDLLRLLHAVAAHQHALASGRKRQGNRPASARHRFVLNVLRVYKRSTGKEHAGGSRRPHESRRGGPAPRFLAAVCGRLRDRLTAEERAHDPELEGELATAAAEAAAANWVESARAWAKDSEQ